MSLKKFSVAIVALLALGAVMASSAAGAVKTEAAKFYVNGAELGGERAVTGAAAEHPEIGTKGRLNTTISGLAVELTSTGIECVNCKISNKAVTEKAGAIAFGSGQIRFTGVSVTKPANCTVKSEAGVEGEVLTRKLVIHGDWMDTEASNKKAFVQFLPETGSVFAQFNLGGTGCSSISGLKNVTGSVFGESKNDTGVEAATQELVFSPAVQTTAGAQLNVGVNKADFTGTGAFSIGGSPEPDKFSIKP